MQFQVFLILWPELKFQLPFDEFWWPSYEVHYHRDPRSPQLETKLEDCCNFVSALAPDIDDNDGVTRGPVPGHQPGA